MNLTQKERVLSFINNRGHLIFFALTAVVSFYYMFLIYRNTLPISEGWYSVYAKSINNGQLPYKDFELLFTPLYTYLISLITSIFGYDIIVLRFFGVLVFVAISVTLYFIFRKMFSPWISMLASLVSVFFLQSECVFIAYDYIRIFDLFIYLASLMLISITQAVKNGAYKKIFIYTFFCGIFSGLSFLTRQSSGTIFVAFVIMSIICLFLVYRTKRYVYVSIIYLLSVLIPIAIQFVVLIATNSFDAFIQSTVTNALSAKGGIQTVLFDWLSRLLPLILQYKSQILCIVLSFIVALLIRHYNKPVEYDEKINTVIGISFAILVITGIGVTLISLYVSYYLRELVFLDNLPVVIFSVVFLIFIVSLILLFKTVKQKKDPTWLTSFIILQGLVLALGFGSGTSAGLSIGETCLAMGIIFASLVKLVGNAYKHRVKLGLVLICGLMIGIFVSYKNLIPYTWWGMTESNTDAITQEIDDVPYLQGLKVSEDAEKMYKGTYSIYQTYLNEDDALFTFPHNPIFYLIADKTPITYSYVQWFDVSSDKALEKDMQTLQESKPKVLTVMFLQEGVMLGHEELFRDGQPSMQRKMQDFLKAFIKKNGYVLVRKYKIDDANYLSNYVRMR